jgi:hypothetical protein
MNQAELRRLLNHLRNQISDSELLAKIQDELRGEDAAEFLREPDLLAHFPVLQDEIEIAGVKWVLRVIPHAHLRMVQRGIGIDSVMNLFQRFVEYCEATGELITTGAYSVSGRPKPRGARIILRFDVDFLSDEQGKAHVITVVIGHSRTGAETVIGFL